MTKKEIKNLEKKEEYVIIPMLLGSGNGMFGVVC